MKKFFALPPVKLGLVIASFITLVLYLHLGRDPLFNWDEGIYAELGRELLEQPSITHILTPTWNYELWLEKPPGIAWLTALSQALFGQNEFGARFFMPLFAGVTLYCLYLIGTKLTGSRVYGLLSLALLANMNLFLSRTRAVNTDGALLAGITTTVYLALSNAPPVFLALVIFFSILFKGLAGFLSLLIALPLLIRKPKSYILDSLFYTLIFTLPWHLYQLFLHGKLFLIPYFQEQVFKRITTPIEYHFESKFFYLNYLIENLGYGWLFLLMAGIVLIIFHLIFLRRQSPSSLITKTRSLTTIIWWFFFPLAVFTLSKTKLFWYILPVYPAIALIVAYLLFTISQLSRHATHLLSLMLVPLFLHTFSFVLKNVEYKRFLAPLPPRVQLAQYVATNYPSTTPLLVLVPSQERLASQILPKEQRLSSTFRYGGMPNLVFYSRRKVKYFYEPKVFLTQTHTLPHALMLLSNSDYPKYAPAGAKIIQQKGDFLLLTK